MSVRVEVDDLSAAVELILQPFVLEALGGAECSMPLREVLPAAADPELLAAAVQRLAVIGAIEPSDEGPFGRHQLTVCGVELLRSLQRLKLVLAALGPRATYGRHLRTRQSGDRLSGHTKGDRFL